MEIKEKYILKTKEEEYEASEEIPPKRVQEVAREVGLDPAVPIRAFYFKGLKDPEGFLPETEEAPWYLVAIPEGDRKIGRSILKHELTHIKLGHKGYEGPEGCALTELEALEVEGGGRHLSVDIASVLTTIVREYNLSIWDASRAIRKAARKLGYPRYIITRGLELGSRYLGAEENS